MNNEYCPYPLPASRIFIFLPEKFFSDFPQFAMNVPSPQEEKIQESVKQGTEGGIFP
jgi:hypothetical protein